MPNGWGGFDLDEFEEALDDSLNTMREAFKGSYKTELNQLLGLSKSEIDMISPGTTNLEKYDELITVVKEASRIDLPEAELKNQIIKLGKVAVKIAKRVPLLAKLLN